jgi:hypothetical protein
LFRFNQPPAIESGERSPWAAAPPIAGRPRRCGPFSDKKVTGICEKMPVTGSATLTFYPAAPSRMILSRPSPTRRVALTVSTTRQACSTTQP